MFPASTASLQQASAPLHPPGKLCENFSQLNRSIFTYAGAGALAIWLHNLRDIEFLPRYREPGRGGYAGKAIKVGKDVKTIKVGDRVGVGAQIQADMTCANCKADQENYCQYHLKSSRISVD